MVSVDRWAASFKSNVSFRISVCRDPELGGYVPLINGIPINAWRSTLWGAFALARREIDARVEMILPSYV